MLIGVGELAAAERCSQEAVALLQPLSEGAEYALACRMQALVALARRDTATTIHWGERAIELAERCGDVDVAGMTAAAVGSAHLIVDYERGRDYLEWFVRRALERAVQELTSPQRRVVRMSTVDCLTDDQIVAVLGVRHGSVRALRFRAIARFGEQIWGGPEAGQRLPRLENRDRVPRLRARAPNDVE